MEENLRKFLEEQKIPETVQHLLELFGITFLDDLETFDEETIAQIELAVRDDEFKSRLRDKCAINIWDSMLQSLKCPSFALWRK